jgi:hypothetical protein
MGMSFTSRGPDEWVRGPARVVDGEVVLDRRRAETYPISQLANLPLDLAMLDTGRPEEITGFIRRYGLLHHGPDKLSSDIGELRESVRDWELAGAGLSQAIRFYSDLRQADRDESWDVLRNSTSLLFSRVYRQALAEDEKPGWTHEDHIGLASKILGAWIDDNLRGCELGVVAAAAQDTRTHHGQLLLAYHPSDLHAAAYAELAMLIANRHELRKCTGCGRWFLPGSSKQKFHDQNCATNARQRRWRQRQSGGAESS